MKVQIYTPQAFGSQANLKKTESSAPIVSLHGFPSLRSKQNRDLAQAVANETGRDVHVLLYSGLTQAPGSFSFRNCVADVHEYVASLREAGRTKVDLIGHSWGGFLSLTLIERFPSLVDRLVLMSPLLDFPAVAASGEMPLTSVKEWMREIAEQHPALNLGDVSERAAEFNRMGTLYSVDHLLGSIPTTTSVLFLQARNDDTTPTPVALDKLTKFSASPEFSLVDTDHSFLTDRPVIAKTIGRFLTQ